MGQSAWSGAPYIPSNTTQKAIDTYIRFISNIGAVIKVIDSNQQKVKAVVQGEQLTRIVQYIYEMAKNERIIAEPLWLENIPAVIYLQSIREKYKVLNKYDRVCAVIGEYDDPNNQRQDVLAIDFANVGNTVIFGNAESGKETLLSTMCYDIINNYSSKEAWLYLLDFGSETLKIFKNAPHVGDVAFINDAEKLERFFDMLSKEMNDRKELLSKYNGDYNLYKIKENAYMPMIFVVLNNFTTFYEMYGNQYDDLLNSITRECVKYRIIFVVTANVAGDIRYRLKQNFKQSITLQQNKEDEYFNVFDKARKMRPSALFGRGLISIKDSIYEFQTATLCKGEDYNNYVLDTIEKVKNKEENKIIAKRIPVLPEVVTFEHLLGENININSVPLGISKNEIEVYKFDFKKNFLTVITGNNIEEINMYISNLVEQFMHIDNIKVTYLDVENLFDKADNNYMEQYQTFTSQFSIAKEEKAHHLCIIIGMDKFIEALGLDKIEFGNYLKEMQQSKKYSFIIADSLAKMKNRSYDDWYKNYTTNDTGIWVGNGFGDQYFLKSNANSRTIINNCGRSFGYAVNRGDLTLIKLLEMKEKENN